MAKQVTLRWREKKEKREERGKREEREGGRFNNR